MKIVDIPNEIIERSQLLKEGKDVYGEDFEITLNFSTEYCLECLGQYLFWLESHLLPIEGL